MRKAIFAVLLMLFVQLNVPIVNADNGRSANVELSVPKYDWFSNETVSISVRVSNTPFGVDLYGNWELKDFKNDVVANGTHIFQASATVTQFNVYMNSFFNGENFYYFSIEIIDSSSSFVGDGDITLIVFQNTVMPQRNNLLVFGDSLSDMGNAKNSILNVPDVPPYWQGRFSNGQVWIEYVSQAYGLSTTIGSGIDQGDNRAFGGSQTGVGYSYVLLPNVGTQISNYVANVQSSISPNDVVSLWSGGNDFLYGTANSNTIVANMETHIRELSAVGAREFIIPNLPPLEKTPEILGRSQNQQNSIASEVISYNQKLLSLIGNISVELGLEIHFIDAWTLFNDIVDNSMALGIVNTQDSACSASATLLPLPICNSASTLASNPDEYLFFDKAHPTRVMHKFISYFAIQSIGYGETDGDGVIDNYDLCPWTEFGKSVDLDGCSWEQLDDDNDNIANGQDNCPSTEIGAVVDIDGCSAEQRDSDDDGLNDAIDPCPFSELLNDHDSDGCTDDIDEDDDNDYVLDIEDNCPKGMIGNHSNDYDLDGCRDIEDIDMDGDQLPNLNEADIGTNPLDEDTDDDGFLDGVDQFPLDPNEWYDSDGDGCGDNSDDFPTDSSECSDSDNDGFGDNIDAFPTDVSEWLDTDGDGFGNNRDACPIVAGNSLSPEGCPDRDGDGFSDDTDLFPSDPDDWADSDGDGYGDNSDLFPNDETDWADLDNDSYGDNRDRFASDPLEWNDTDGDTVGDNSDVFPEDPTEWIDSDGDGCGDNIDVWPLDPSECFDRDVDGIGDNSDLFPDDRAEWNDTDGDGLGDNEDLFPNDSKAKYDDDGDGLANYYDPFPDNENMDSWFDLILRLIIIGGVIGAIIFAVKKNSETKHPVPWHQYNDEEMLEAAETDNILPEKPTGPPPPGSFQ